MSAGLRYIYGSNASRTRFPAQATHARGSVPVTPLRRCLPLIAADAAPISGARLPSAAAGALAPRHDCAVRRRRLHRAYAPVLRPRPRIWFCPSAAGICASHGRRVSTHRPIRRAVPSSPRALATLLVTRGRRRRPAPSCVTRPASFVLPPWLPLSPTTGCLAPSTPALSLRHPLPRYPRPSCRPALCRFRPAVTGHTNGVSLLACVFRAPVLSARGLYAHGRLRALPNLTAGLCRIDRRCWRCLPALAAASPPTSAFVGWRCLRSARSPDVRAAQSGAWHASDLFTPPPPFSPFAQSRSPTCSRRCATHSSRVPHLPPPPSRCCAPTTLPPPPPPFSSPPSSPPRG